MGGLGRDSARGGRRVEQQEEEEGAEGANGADGSDYILRCPGEPIRHARTTRCPSQTQLALPGGEKKKEDRIRMATGKRLLSLTRHLVSY